MEAAEAQVRAWGAEIEQIGSLRHELDTSLADNEGLRKQLAAETAAAAATHALQDSLDAAREQVSMLQHCAEAVHSYGSAWLPLTEALKQSAQKETDAFSTFLRDAIVKVRCVLLKLMPPLRCCNSRHFLYDGCCRCDQLESTWQQACQSAKQRQLLTWKGA